MNQTGDSQAIEPRMVSVEKPNAARAYDYYLGGSCNTAIDRDFADEILTIFPPAKTAALINRNYLRRCVTHLMTEHGVRQFLDLGSGIPTVGNVHEVAHNIDPHTRVAYVDLEPIAVEQSRILLTDNPNTTVLQADLRKPIEVLDDEQIRSFLDITQPIAVLMIAVLHFVGDDENPAEIIDTYRQTLTAGSFVAISHLSDETASHHVKRQVAECIDRYREKSAYVYSRDRETLRHWMRNLDILTPGITTAADWHPDDTVTDAPERQLVIGGVGRIT